MPSQIITPYTQEVCDTSSLKNRKESTHHVIAEVKKQTGLTFKLL